MIGKHHLLMISSWIYFTHSAQIKFQQIQFLPAATSFTSRSDHYSSTNIATGESRLNQEQGFFNYEHLLSDPDPFLITGIEAKELAAYLYGKGLFFQDIRHERGLIYNQNQRRRNGLKPHRLGSLRLDSPWIRF